MISTAGAGGTTATMTTKPTFRQFMESEDLLGDLKFVLALRKEYGLTKQQSNEVIRWFRDMVDWEDLEHGARDVFIAKWDPDTVDRHPGMTYGDFVMDQIHMDLKKYQLDTRELIG